MLVKDVNLRGPVRAGLKLNGNSLFDSNRPFYKGVIQDIDDMFRNAIKFPSAPCEKYIIF